MKWPSHQKAGNEMRGRTNFHHLLAVREMCWLPAFLALCVCCCSGLLAQTTAPLEYPEYQVKAVYLWNFTRYVDWPARSFRQPNSPLAIGILGQDRFGDDLRKLVADKKVDGHELVVRKVETIDQSRECQILFISGSERKRTAEIIQALKGAPVLTVGESEGFIQAGGIINFRVRNRDLILDINRIAAEKVGLRISSKLLQMGEKGRDSR